jgi:hypothetical protein
MDIKHMSRRCLILVAIIACAVLLTGTDGILAQEDDQPKPSDGLEQQSPSPDGKGTSKDTRLEKGGSVVPPMWSGIWTIAFRNGARSWS